MTFRRRKRELIKECDVYLSGRYAEYRETHHQPIPDWAWLSVLAHARPEQIRTLGTHLGDRGRWLTQTTVWWQAIEFLAGQILSQHDDDQSLDELRRSVLVPLELTWLNERQPRQSPRQLVKTVLDALDHYPSSQPR
jgi:hypothetical protein